ncbi:MAG: four helix bundle protein [Planctomycetota bacterium]
MQAGRSGRGRYPPRQTKEDPSRDPRNAWTLSSRNNTWFPAEDRYALTSQLRRSSRSPCRSLREARAKRRDEAHFVSKLTVFLAETRD